MTKDRPKEHRKRRRKRPIAVTIIALLLVGEILLRLYWVAGTVLTYRLWELRLPGPLWAAYGPSPLGIELATAAFRLLWLLVGLAVLIGLLRMRRWSWVWLVAWTGISLTIGLLHYFYRFGTVFSPADYAVMAADMLLVFALNQSDVQRIYGLRRDDVEQLG
jgi:hypothetical protein